MQKQKRFSHAQGTIEYLVILGVIIVISLIVISIITNIFESQSVLEKNNKLKNIIGSGGISVVESQIDPEGNAITVLKNTTTDPITILTQNSTTTLPGGSSNKTYFDWDSCACPIGQKSIVCTQDITYQTKHGLQKTLTITQEIECTDQDIELPPTLHFALGIGKSEFLGLNKINTIDTDNSDNIYIAGQFRGTIEFGDTSFTSLNETGSGDVFISKLNKYSEFQWTKQIMGAHTITSRKIKIDQSGNIIFLGSFNGIITIDEYTLDSCISTTSLIIKFDQSGNIIWITKSCGITFGNSGNDMDLDSDGNIYLTGYFKGETHFGNNILTSSSQDIFVAKINGDTNEWIWATSAGGSDSDTSNSIVVNKNNEVFIGSRVYCPATFGSNTINSCSNMGAAVAKINSQTNNWEWVAKADSSADDHIFGLVADSSGDIYASNSFYNEMIFGTESVSSVGNTDVFIAKLSKDSNTWIWANSLGGSGYEYFGGITIDNSDNIYLTGDFIGSANIGSHTVSSNYGSSDSDIFIARLNSETNTWTGVKSGGGEDGGWFESDSSKAIAIDSSGDILVGGIFVDGAVFDNTILEGGENTDILLWKTTSNFD